MNKWVRNISKYRLRLVLMVSANAFVLASAPLPILAADWVTGDIFAGVANGQHQIYSNDGVYKEMISNDLPSSLTTGCAFNPSLDKFYTTTYSNHKVVVYDDTDPHPILQEIDTSPPRDYIVRNESIVFDAIGRFYVGHPGNKSAPDADVLDDIRQYDSAGNFLQAFDADTENVGTDWLELASDQKTLFYTSEGERVMRYDLSANGGTGAQLPDFAVDLGEEPTYAAYAIRLLWPGDGSGGMLVAHNADILRLDANGQVVWTYDVPGEDNWFSLNLDPNGTSFWAGNYETGNFYRFNIDSRAVELGPINTGTGRQTLFGICVKGEPTAAMPSAKKGGMTGGGSVITEDGRRVSHGFQLHCDASKKPQDLEVNWEGNKFHLERVTSTSCSDDPTINEAPPVAGLDTFGGTGTGRYNGVDGATAKWTFTDAGEPGGDKDTASIEIRDAMNWIVLQVSSSLDKGNQQAHK